MNPEQSKLEFSQELEGLLDSIKKDGPNVNLDTVRQITVRLFPQEFISQLQSRGLEIKTYNSGSEKKLEFFLEMKLPKGERQIALRYKNGQCRLRVLNGVMNGEQVLSEEIVSGSLDEVADKARRLAEEIASK